MNEYQWKRTITKQEFIEMVKKAIPDDAKVYPFGVKCEDYEDTICCIWEK